MRDQILKTIRDHLYNEMSVDRDIVDESKNLLSDLGLDSIDKINLVMKMESVHDVFIADDLIIDMHKVSDVIDVVERLIKNHERVN